MDWVGSLNGAIGYIEDNILTDVTCSQIANHVFISSAHLQRCFYSLTGLTIGEYVRNRRLTLAAHELAAKRVKVIDAALKYGYETPEAFSKAFARFHGVAPSRAGRFGTFLKSFNRMSVKIIMEGGSVMDYRIEKREAFGVVVMAKDFNTDNDTKAEIPAFWDEYFSRGFEKKIPPVLGVCAPHEQGGKFFRYGIGCFEENAGGVPEGFERWEIPASSWAVFKCVGAMPGAIQEMWGRIYGEWLPQANYELHESYDFEYYTEGDVNSPDYVSEIWASVREK